MHPSYEIEREYAVRVMGLLSQTQAQQLLDGIELEEGFAKFDRIEDQGGEGSNHWYHVVLKEGRKREVRRIFQAIGLMVSRLIRVRYGDIMLPSRVKRGQYLDLEPLQVEALLRSVGIIEPQEEKPHVTKRHVVSSHDLKPSQPTRAGQGKAGPARKASRPGHSFPGRDSGENAPRQRRKPR